MPDKNTHEALFPQICRGVSHVYKLLGVLAACMLVYYFLQNRMGTGGWRVFLLEYGFETGFLRLMAFSLSCSFLVLSTALSHLSIAKPIRRKLLGWAILTASIAMFIVYARVQISGSGLVYFDPPPPGHLGTWAIATEIPYVSHRNTEIVQLLFVLLLPVVPVLGLCAFQQKQVH
jgi:hypothetical protein